MKKIAIFDLDETLDKEDIFKRFILKVFLITPKKWIYLPILTLKYLQFILKINNFSRSDFKVFLIKLIFKKQDKNFLEKFSQNFVKPRFKKKINQKVLKELLNKKQSNYHLILATGSLDIYAKFYKQKFKFDYLISSKLEIKNNTYSGNLINGNCIKKIKYKEVNKYLNRNGLSWNNVTFYSDHINDMCIFKRSKKNYVINPSRYLLKILIRKRITFEIIN